MQAEQQCAEGLATLPIGQYCVVDFRPATAEAAEITVAHVRSPEAAAMQSLGIDLARSGKTKDLLAKVYFRNQGEVMNLAKLYRRTAAD